jgi:dipeptidyl aminopeptidase/acylaminoacyl peptidase
MPIRTARPFRTSLLALAATLAALSTGHAQGAAPAPATAVTTSTATDVPPRLPIFAFVHDEVLSGLAMSPDGKHIAGISLPSIDGIPQVTVWSADDLAKPPLRFDLTAADGSRWKPSSVRWLNDQRLIATGFQTIDYSVGGRMIKDFNVNAFVYEFNSLSEPSRNRLAEPFESLLTTRRGGRNGSVTLDKPVPGDPSRVILRVENYDGGTDLYEFNLKDYSSRRVYRGRPGDSLQTDPFGQPRLRTYFEEKDGNAQIIYEARIGDTDQWKKLPPFTAKAREGMEPIGASKDPDVIYVTDNTGREFRRIHEYRVSTGELSEPIFEHPRFEATGVVVGRGKRLGELLGFRYDGLYRGMTYWVDEDLARIHASLSKTFPGKQVRPNLDIGTSDDGRRSIVYVYGSNDPGAYYLYDAAKGLTLLGKVRPLLDPAQLPEVRFVTYKARDGMTIPAYLTVPKGGSKPYPTVVMPHGGPWARDYMRFDEWVQFLANRGYAVLQPQYRGSDGWGQKLWRAGDREWGQKMQDDKDDGAAWLVQQGIADKDRIGMYGFSYGGYAAMAAIVRPNPPYQCAIAGAGLSELRTFDKLTFGSRFGRQFQNPTIAGLSPLDKVQDASIPIMIFHGDRDQTVPIEQSEKYHAALKAAGKDTQYIEVKDYGHGPSLSPLQRGKVLEILESYFADGCGPGGL